MILRRLSKIVQFRYKSKIPECVVEQIYNTDVYPLKFPLEKTQLFNYHWKYMHNEEIESLKKENKETIIENKLDNKFNFTFNGMYESISENLYFLNSNWRSLTLEEKVLVKKLGFPDLNFPIKLSPFENVEQKSTSLPLSMIPRMLEYNAHPIEILDMNGPLKRILREELSHFSNELIVNIVKNDYNKEKIKLYYGYIKNQLSFIENMSTNLNKDIDLLKLEFYNFYQNYKLNSHRNLNYFLQKCILQDSLEKKHYLNMRKTIMKDLPNWRNWTKVHWELLQFSNM